MNPLTTTAAALRTRDSRYPWIGPTPDEAEIADLLDELAALHIETGPRCSGCAETWPCKGWVYGQDLAVQWLGRASERVLARATKATAPDPAREPVRLGELLPGLVDRLTETTAQHRTNQHHEGDQP